MDELTPARKRALEALRAGPTGPLARESLWERVIHAWQRWRALRRIAQFNRRVRIDTAKFNKRNVVQPP